MNFALVLIGDELLNGNTRDANAYWLAQELEQRGHNLKTILTISDGVDPFVSTMKAVSNVDVIVTSGGLGPTKDDFTKEALAAFLGEPLEFSREAEAIAKENCAKRKFAYSDKNGYQFVPASTKPVPNPCGIAPGLLTTKGTQVLCLPGVPKEFKAMCCEFLSNHETENSHKRICYRTAFTPEERIFRETDPHLWERLGQLGKVSSLPRSVGVDLVIRLEGDLESRELELDQIIHNSPVSEIIWQKGEVDLEQLIVEKLSKLGKTISTAESCTGGLIASNLTDIPGSSSCFAQALVTYSEGTKIKELGVSPETLENHGVVSEQCATEMALGLQKATSCDYAISTTGIAGPSGGAPETPEGTVYVGIKTPLKTSTYHYIARGDRLERKFRFARFALLKLWMDHLKDA